MKPCVIFEFWIINIYFLNFLGFSSSHCITGIMMRLLKSHEITWQKCFGEHFPFSLASFSEELFHRQAGWSQSKHKWSKSWGCFVSPSHARCAQAERGWDADESLEQPEHQGRLLVWNQRSLNRSCVTESDSFLIKPTICSWTNYLHSRSLVPLSVKLEVATFALKGCRDG